MAAEQYGRRLIDEVQSETLDELLRDLRAHLNQISRDELGVSSLDRLLEVFRYHQRATPVPRPGWMPEETVEDNPNMGDAAPETPQRSTNRPAILEITAHHSAAGKTTLLYYLAAKSLLPQEYGGKASIVVWIDTDGRFSAVRLYQIMAQLISRSPFVNDFAKSALQHLYVFHPSTSSQLLAHLHTLPSKLLALNSPRPISLLVLDSATAFQYQDRFDANLTRLEAGADYSSRPKSLSRTSQIIAALRTIQTRFECAIVFSTSPPRQPSTISTTPQTGFIDPGQPSTTTAAPTPSEARPISPWTQLATLTLALSRLPVSQFAPSMSLEECLRDREKRQEAVAAGKFSIGVDWRGSERWPPGVRESMEGLEGRGRVGMVISAAGSAVDGGGGGGGGGEGEVLGQRGGVVAIE